MHINNLMAQLHQLISGITPYWDGPCTSARLRILDSVAVDSKVYQTVGVAPLCMVLNG